ncbi:MAG: hypothetical protein ACRCZO_17765, partial [Cetobacterium sp.]
SKVENVGQKCTFSHKLAIFGCHIYISSSTVTEWKAQDSGISKAAKDTYASFKNRSKEGIS